jgi:hypothetical protein
VSDKELVHIESIGNTGWAEKAGRAVLPLRAFLFVMEHYQLSKPTANKQRIPYAV